MKRLTFIVFFIGVNILFIFLHVHKKGRIIKFSHQNQKKELELETLMQQKEALIHQMQAFKNPAVIKKYAEQELNMKKINISQIKLAPNQSE